MGGGDREREGGMQAGFCARPPPTSTRSLNSQGAESLANADLLKLSPGHLRGLFAE